MTHNTPYQDGNRVITHKPDGTTDIVYCLDTYAAAALVAKTRKPADWPHGLVIEICQSSRDPHRDGLD